LALVALPSVPAQAASVATDPIGAERARGPHCVLTVDPVEPGTSADTAADPADLTCFDTFSRSIAFATRNQVRLPADATPVTAHARLVASSGPLLGVEYDATGYGGASIAITGSSGSGCYDGRQYHINDLRDYGFNDRISSAKLYSNCYARHYEHSSLNGDSYLCYPNCSTLGAMNNRSTSIRYF
ncbi:MAG TPA: hypothetical protein VI076_08780, partial [Actinopolymorphaceae bacterium]